MMMMMMMVMIKPVEKKFLFWFLDLFLFHRKRMAVLMMVVKA